MLTELRVRNFAIIESVSLPLARGFNVLSGETGAGKSIIVGALGFLPGERARDAWNALSAAKREISELERRRADAAKRADYLRHVAHEIDGAKLVEGEDVRLEDEARRLENAEELRELASGISAAIEGEEN